MSHTPVRLPFAGLEERHEYSVHSRNRGTVVSIRFRDDSHRRLSLIPKNLSSPKLRMRKNSAGSSLWRWRIGARDCCGRFACVCVVGAEGSVQIAETLGAMSVRRCLGSRGGGVLARARNLAGVLDDRLSLRLSQGIGDAFLDRVLRHLGTLVEYKQDALSDSKWKVVRRPLLDIELRRYAQMPLVPQPLILHGPRGVGKRTAIEGLLEEWSRDGHVTAYVDLYSQVGAAIDGKCAPPWTLSPSCPASGVMNQGGSDLQWIRRKLEQGLESLAIQAVQAGCLKSKNVFDVLVDRHTIDGALSEFLHSQATGTGNSGTKQLWHHALLYMQRAAGVASQPIHSRAIAPIDEVLLAVLENADRGPVDIILSDGSGRRNIKHARPQFDVKEKALLSLALAKHLLQIQEHWKVAAGADRKRQGLTPKGLVDAAVSWPALLLELVSWATQEGVFQPKLVINGLEILRNASMVMGGLDGSLYHDGFLLQLVNNSLTQGSFPVILVSSDSFYSWQLDDDFGSTDTFISNEIFGWTPNEAALHLVPSVFTADEWKVVVAVLGSNPRHSVELLHLRHSKAFSERMKDDDALDIEDCIDLYLAYLQVTVVDPAMYTALGLLEQFADKAMKGDIDSNLLQHGAPWRDFPRNDDKERRQQWARIQMIDFVQAFTDTEFGVNYLGGDLELLDDPAARALVQVGLLYQQRAPPFVRPTSRGILRCLTRWLVKQKLHLGSSEKLRYKWHRLIRGRSYRHLMRE